jgi:hypothetical protein
MPTPTYTPLATVTLGSSASSVTFSSIPATYRDLVLVMNASITTGSQVVRIRYNGDTGSNYPYVYIYADGSSATSGAGTSAFAEAGTISTGPSVVISQIMDYSATDKHKSAITRTNIQGVNVLAWATRWANTAAITSIELTLTGSTYTAGSTFALYAIAS